MGRKPKEEKKYPGVRIDNGRYTYRYSVPKPGGGRKQKETPSYPTAKEAFEAGILIKAEIANGTFVDEDNILFTVWCDKWLEMYAAPGKVKERTVDIRRESLKPARKFFEGIKLKDITKAQYQDLLNDMKKRKTAGQMKHAYSQQTIKMLHTAMGMVFRKAVKMGIVKTDVTLDAELPSFQKSVAEIENEDQLPKFLEKEELALLLKTAKTLNDPQGYHALFILAYTGMRIGELCALKTSDIDEINRKISITKTLNDKKGIKRFTLNTPKTKSSIRKIDVSETVIKILNQQANWKKTLRISVGAEYYSKEDFVFVNEDQMPGKPARLQRFNNFMTKALKAANLPDTLTPHSLRHTYTSLMAEAGVELSSLQRLLGHKNDIITEQVYRHVTKAKKREAVEKLDNLMNGLL